MDYSMKTSKLFALSLVTVLWLVLPGAVFATEECTTSTGSYGQTSTTCKVLGETTTITHTTVSAGIGDVNFWMLTGVLVAASGLLFGVSKLTQKIYWFD